MTRIQNSRHEAPQVPAAGTGHASTAESTLGFERVVFFSDAVFAIVITLLVLPLTAEIELPENGEGLARQVMGLWPTVLTFAVSFLVIGQFWIAHHRTFGNLRCHDQGLLWFNLFALMTVAFMPFPAALLGSHPTADDAFPVVFYALSLTLTSASLTGVWLYALRRGLVDPSLTVADARAISLRAVATTAVFAFSVGVAFVGLTPAVILWIGVLPTVRLLIARRPRARA